MRLIVLAIALACGSAHAARLPVSSGEDESVKQVVFSSTDVVRVKLKLGYFTRIILNPDEQVVAIHNGFPDGYVTTITPSGVTIELQSVVVGEVTVQPNDEWNTNIEIETDMRSYMLTTEVSETYDYRVKMMYPDEVELARVAALESEKAAEIKAMPTPIRCTNFDYEAVPGDKSRDIVPKTVCDDGVHTFIRFHKNTQLPSVKLGLGKDESIVDKDVESARPDTIRVKTIADQITLRLNKGGTWKVVTINNLAFSEKSE